MEGGRLAGARRGRGGTVDTSVAALTVKGILPHGRGRTREREKCRVAGGGQGEQGEQDGGWSGRRARENHRGKCGRRKGKKGNAERAQDCRRIEKGGERERERVKEGGRIRETEEIERRSPWKRERRLSASCVTRTLVLSQGVIRIFLFSRVWLRAAQAGCTCEWMANLMVCLEAEWHLPPG